MAKSITEMQQELMEMWITTAERAAVRIANEKQPFMYRWLKHERARQTVIRFLGENPYNPENVITWRRYGKSEGLTRSQAKTCNRAVENSLKQ